MILYHSPGSCSTASLLALAESGLPHEVRIVNVPAGETRTAEYAGINAWAKVPALDLNDGTVLTESIAILNYIADLVPERRLLPPPGTLARARALSFMALLTGTVHIAFRPLFRPDQLAATPQGQADVQGTGIVALNGVLGVLEQEINGDHTVLVDGFSLCDVYALVFAHWTLRPQVQGRLVATPRLHAVGRATQMRPAVSKALPNIRHLR